MSLEQVKEIARRYEMEHPQKPDVIDEVFSADARIHFAFPGLPDPLDRAAFKQVAAGFGAAMPDITHNVEEIVAEDERAVVRWSGYATFTNALMGIPPTGKRGETTGTGVYHIRDGAIVEAWVNFDALGFLQQIGVVPAMGPA